eukprot:CAMPEP_0206187442 /NCGR_PEP_ID=MMETSP0166-20121206/3004_1 /ASSEMBLY_ACC=CAM_ASM_000260 /TAXON_ID=95228 /ORGANISM="Vannella robusta, Strain DIVA3 518/3/11/1/6" /LENGTH=329 /DNA_ID=CAMNT_0053603025 /DNA_START=11 /DNA_END=1001 /DNA_ORIENTATION=-
MLGGGNTSLAIEKSSGPSFDLQLQQLAALVKDNTELLHALRELKPVKPRKIQVQAEEVAEDKFSGPEASVPQKSIKKVVSVTEVHKEGSLYLQNSSNGWNKYYLVLTVSQISIYKNRDAPRLAHIKLGSLSTERGKLKYSIILRNAKEASVLVLESDSEIALDDLASSIVLRSRNENEMDEWEAQSCILKTNRFMGEGDEDDSFDLLEDEDDTFSDEQGFTDDEPARELEVKNEKAELRSSTDYLGFAKNNRQKQLLKGMVKHLGQSFDPQRHDGATLMRFLRARQMDPSKASEMLKARIEWEKKVQPDTITLDMVKSEAVKKKLFPRF